MKKQLRIVFVFAVVSIHSDVFARLDHVCAYSNESVDKFRKKAIGSSSLDSAYKACTADKVIGKKIPLFDWPVDLCQFWVSSLFGLRSHQGITKHHGGVDMAAYQGTDVKASAPGLVIRTEHGAAGYGNVVEIQHKGAFMTRYGHLDEISVKNGQQVKRGDIIGTVGATGNVRGKNDPSHLHFEIVLDGVRVEPLKYLYCAEVAFQKE